MEELAAPAPGTQVLRRAHDILRLLARHQRDGVRVTDIATALGLEPPTAHRLVQGLVQERMAVQDKSLRRYFLGPALYELGISAGARFPLRDFVQPSVDRLARATGDSAVVTIRSGLDGVCLEHRSGEFPIRTSFVTVGTRRPLAAGAGGLAILSCLADDERRRLVAANAVQMEVDAGELAARVDEARRVGHALNIYRRTTPPISAIGVPIMGAFGQCVVGISVVALSMRLSGKRRSDVLGMLRDEAQEIGRQVSVETLPAA
ncbi:MAG TPA: IclR family transcriptional regulator [Burkholderiaceae bacterium]